MTFNEKSHFDRIGKKLLLKLSRVSAVSPFAEFHHDCHNLLTTATIATIIISEQAF